MTLEDLLAFARSSESFNDIEFFSESKSTFGGLLAREVPGLVAFAQHRSASLYALYRGHVVWLDSEGEQLVLAKDIDHFVDALHLYAGSVYDVASACQVYAQELAVLERRFDSAWRQEASESAAEYEGHAAFTEWARGRGRGVPDDLVSRIYALRPLADDLRKTAQR